MMIRLPPVPLPSLALFGALAIAASAPATAQTTQDPDWPCIQRKVPELSVAAIWSGPEVDPETARWQDDLEVAELAAQIASRRLPEQEATDSIQKFAAGLKPEEKEKRLTLLFAGIFAALERERNEVMSGIDRYARAQKAMADQIRQDQSRLSDVNSAGGNPQQVTDLTNQLAAQVRVFNDRQSSLTIVCEVPTLIEQRLFALARAIQGHLQG